MSTSEATAVAMRLAAAAEALTALGAHLRVVQEGIDADPEVAGLLEQVALEVAPGGVAAAERPALIGFIRAFLAQALDVLERPDRKPGWAFDDPTILQSQGRASAVLVEVFAAAGLDRAVARPGAAMLDVGTGAGWLAIGFAARHPNARVVGIDTFEPALALARANVREAGLDERIELRRQDIVDLRDTEAFDLVWLPGPFLGLDVMRRAVNAARRALRPGGVAVAGLYGGIPDRLTTLLSDLRTVRGGGHPWQGPDLGTLLEDAGLVEVRELERVWSAPIRLVSGVAP